MTTNYRKGADKERRIVNKARERGCLAFRSAGSHTIVDVCVINPILKKIWLIQSKLRGKQNLSGKEIDRIIEKGKILDGTYEVVFSLWT